MTKKVVVFIDWEGRGYEGRSWKKDKTQAMKLLGSPKAFYAAPFDCGLLVATHPLKASDKPEMFETRHGQSGPACTKESLAEDFVEGKQYAFGDIFQSEDRGRWEKFASFKELEIKHKDWFDVNDEGMEE